MERVKSNNQQEVFTKIVDMKHKIQMLAGFVQNDFNMMLDDGTATKDEIKQSIIDMNKSFDKVIKELNTLREECALIISKAAQ